MKKIIALCLLLLTLLCCPSVFADRPIQAGRKDYEMIAPESYEGYWEEKAGGRLLISVTPADEPEWYDVTVAARDKLPKMDVYIMRAHYQKDGRYRNGSGLLYYSFDENVLYWTDYTLKPEKRVRSFIKTASPDADEAM